MHTVMWTFKVPAGTSKAQLIETINATAHTYEGIPGLIRKYYLRSADGRTAGGVYLWESRAAAEAVYDAEWTARVEKLYGGKPTITWFDTPVVVDNAAGAITKAA